MRLGTRPLPPTILPLTTTSSPPSKAARSPEQTVEDVGHFGDPVDVELKAGEMSLHSDLLLHSSKANLSSRRRCGTTLRYCAADVRPYLGWSGKGVVIRGHDPSGHWGDPGRPAAD